MKRLIRSFLNRRHRRNPPQLPRGDGGFTMIELIVGMVITFLIITPLLGFVVTILNDDRNEGEKAAMEQELQAALDYIASDLSQAFYIYDQAQIDQITELQINGNSPVMVFWMKHTLPDALPPITQIDSATPKECQEDNDEDFCDDTSVNAVVAYYLFENNEGPWCEPEGNPCPKRIVRYLIQGPLEKAKGTGVYYDPDDLTGSQKASAAFNDDFDISVLVDNEAAATTGVVDSTPTEGEVLINYIDSFELDSVSDTHDLAKFTIRGNAMRRIRATEDDYCTKDENGDGRPDNASYCPEVGIQVEGLPIQ